jgi:hypothetical protein
MRTGKKGTNKKTWRKSKQVGPSLSNVYHSEEGLERAVFVLELSFRRTSRRSRDPSSGVGIVIGLDWPHR